MSYVSSHPTFTSGDVKHGKSCPSKSSTNRIDPGSLGHSEDGHHLGQHPNTQPPCVSARCAYFGRRSHEAKCPKQFWFAASSTPRPRQYESSRTTSSGVMGDHPCHTSSCPAYANVCSVYS